MADALERLKLAAIHYAKWPPHAATGPAGKAAKNLSEAAYAYAASVKEAGRDDQ